MEKGCSAFSSRLLNYHTKNIKILITLSADNAIFSQGSPGSLYI